MVYGGQPCAIENNCMLAFVAAHKGNNIDGKPNWGCWNAENAIIKENVEISPAHRITVCRQLHSNCQHCQCPAQWHSGFTLPFSPHRSLPHLFLSWPSSPAASLCLVQKTSEANPQFFSTNMFFFSYLNSCNVGGLFVSFTSGIVCTGRVRLQVSPPSSPSSLLQTTWMSTTTKVWDTHAQIHTHTHTQLHRKLYNSMPILSQVWRGTNTNNCGGTWQIQTARLHTHIEHCMNNMMPGELFQGQS